MKQSRRQILQALAATTATLPLARMLRAAPDAAPKRLVLVMQNNGTQQKSFWPDASLSSPILDALFLDPATKKNNGLRAKTNLIKGVYVPPDANGTGANNHDIGFARMFTGEKLMSVGDAPWGGGPSVDQIVAKAWNVDSLTLAVLASNILPMPKPGRLHRESFCYLGPATLKHPRRDPLAVFNYLFGHSDAAADRRLSVLGAVSGNLAEVSSRLGAAEKAKLDYHLTAIHDVERRIKSNAATCSVMPSPPKNYLAENPAYEVNDETYVPQMVDDMVDLAVLGLQCNRTRIATLQLNFGGGIWSFGWEGIGMNTHDDVAHWDQADDGTSPRGPDADALNVERLVRMNRFYARAVARLATKLDAIPEGDGTMLDNTLVVWANEQGRGDHDQNNVPIVLIGKAGGAIEKGGRVIDEGPQVFNRLGCTVLNAMGLEREGFGDEPTCGSFAGLV